MAAFNGKYWYVLSGKILSMGSMLSGIFLLLMLVHGLYKAAGKGIVLLVSFHRFTNVCISAVPRMDEYGVSRF